MNEVMTGDNILSGKQPIKMRDLFKLISRILGMITTFLSVTLFLGVMIASTLMILSIGKVDYIEKSSEDGGR
jgi:hypothetical protein